MSKFIYKQTNDKVYHIYLDDPSKEGFTKVGQAKSISFIKEHNSKYILLFNDDGLTKRLFGIIENKIFQVTIPKNSKVLIFDSICVYEKDSIWYTMVLKKDAFEELLLGEKHEIYLGCPENIKYKTLFWCFFTKKAEQYLEIYSIVEKKVVNLGKYSSVEHNHNGALLAKLSNGFYDFFTPKSVEPHQGCINETFETLDHLFVWNDNHKHWIAYKGKVFCKNAVYEVQTCDDKRKILLYELKDGTLKLVRESYNFQFVAHPFGIIIDNQIYSQDVESGLIDFDNPKPTLKKRIRDFFK
ncbi:MAG: hypothetical protein IKW58_01430 [Alphaproteobacteria bacterium]|nr:hypothetical protein [Alphaproteobacteria bacterium]